ncbi:MAG: hypothetical protein ACK559_36460, partial [bacterium]
MHPGGHAREAEAAVGARGRLEHPPVGAHEGHRDVGEGSARAELDEGPRHVDRQVRGGTLGHRLRGRGGVLHEVVG